MGWTTRRPRMPTQEVLETRYLPMLKEAVQKGARLVVSPETGFVPSKEELPGLLERISQAAQEHKVSLVVGYFHREKNDNRIAFIDPAGKTLAEYRKTHLIAGIERYTPGDGTLVVLPFEGFQLGGMICQDDNFTDLARGYGRKRVSLMAVPTNDWLQVKHYHFENSLFRGMENRYAIVRAATNGLSAIVSARGEVLAQRDPFEKGQGVVVADLPLYAPGSLYAKAGNWLVVVCLALLVAGVLLGRSRE
jgi:apolipoprotein N-acyltransferase